MLNRELNDNVMPKITKKNVRTTNEDSEVMSLKSLSTTLIASGLSLFFKKSEKEQFAVLKDHSKDQDNE